jgi:hypothetical protein
VLLTPLQANNPECCDLFAGYNSRMEQRIFDVRERHCEMKRRLAFSSLLYRALSHMLATVQIPLRHSRARRSAIGEHKSGNRILR